VEWAAATAYFPLLQKGYEKISALFIHLIRYREPRGET